jgi:hypothetical protein
MEKIDCGTSFGIEAKLNSNIGSERGGLAWCHCLLTKAVNSASFGGRQMHHPLCTITRDRAREVLK